MNSKRLQCKRKQAKYYFKYDIHVYRAMIEKYYKSSDNFTYNYVLYIIHE